MIVPSALQLRKVAKVTPLSWLRMQLKQLIEKVMVVHILPVSVLHNLHFGITRQRR